MSISDPLDPRRPSSRLPTAVYEATIANLTQAVSNVAPISSSPEAVKFDVAAVCSMALSNTGPSGDAFAQGVALFNDWIPVCNRQCQEEDGTPADTDAEREELPNCATSCSDKDLADQLSQWSDPNLGRKFTEGQITGMLAYFKSSTYNGGVRAASVCCDRSVEMCAKGECRNQNYCEWCNEGVLWEGWHSGSHCQAAGLDCETCGECWTGKFYWKIEEQPTAWGIQSWAPGELYSVGDIVQMGDGDDPPFNGEYYIATGGGPQGVLSPRNSEVAYCSTADFLGGCCTWFWNEADEDKVPAYLWADEGSIDCSPVCCVEEPCRICLSSRFPSGTKEEFASWYPCADKSEEEVWWEIESGRWLYNCPVGINKGFCDLSMGPVPPQATAYHLTWAGNWDAVESPYWKKVSAEWLAEQQNLATLWKVSACCVGGNVPGGSWACGGGYDPGAMCGPPESSHSCLGEREEPCPNCIDFNHLLTLYNDAGQPDS